MRTAINTEPATPESVTDKCIEDGIAIIKQDVINDKHLKAY